MQNVLFHVCVPWGGATTQAIVMYFGTSLDLAGSNNLSSFGADRVLLSFGVTMVTQRKDVWPNLIAIRYRVDMWSEVPIIQRFFDEKFGDRQTDCQLCRPSDMSITDAEMTCLIYSAWRL